MTKALVYKLIFVLSCAAVPAYAKVYPGEPAMLVMYAKRGVVEQTNDGMKLTLEGVHPVVTVNSNMHEDRRFDAFPVTDFAEHYNSCNDMKHAEDMWHEDGANSLFIYRKGPKNGNNASVRAHSPLVTNPNAMDDSRIVMKKAGAVPVFLDEVTYDPWGSEMVFEFEAVNPIKTGVYKGIILKAECLDALGN